MSKPAKILSFCLALAITALPPTVTEGQQASLDELARSVDRAESMRAVKNLQRTYAQYSQFGLWNEMADLFANEGSYIFDDETVRGRKAIGEHLTTREGGGEQGL